MPQVNYEQLTHDLSLRYNQTYVRYKTKDSPYYVTAYINSISDPVNDYPQLTLNTYNQGTQLVSYNGEGEFDFTLPVSGYFNYRNIGFVSYYRPSRQNKRSLHSGLNIRANFYSKNRMVLGPNLDLPCANAIFNPEYMEYVPALERLNKRTNYCIALDNRFAIGLNPTVDKNHILFHYFTPVASISPEGAIVKSYHPSLERLVNEAPLRRF